MTARTGRKQGEKMIQTRTLYLAGQAWGGRVNEAEYSGQDDEVNIFAGLDRIKEEGTSSDRWEREKQILTHHTAREDSTAAA